MNINCIHCGHKFDLGKAYDDYEGLVKCSTCRGMLDIRTQDGQVRGVRPWMAQASAAPAAQPEPAAPLVMAGASGMNPPLSITGEPVREAA